MLILLRKNERTNPLMIARIFAMTVQRVLDGIAGKDGGEVDPQKAFAPFANFISNEERSPDDEEALRLIREALLENPSVESKKAELVQGNKVCH
jgi:hypothetical protein